MKGEGEQDEITRVPSPPVKYPVQRCIGRKYVFITELLSAHLNSYISERSRKANNLSRDHTLVKIIAKLRDAHSFNYQPASSPPLPRVLSPTFPRFLPIRLAHLVPPNTWQLPSFLCLFLLFFLFLFLLSTMVLFPFSFFFSVFFFFFFFLGGLC